MAAIAQPSCERIVDRYAIYDQIAVGGMAVVHLGRLLGQAGFSRTVAIKRLHPQFASNPDFVAMFLDEARLAVRVQHPNVVAPLDVLMENGELFVVMDYVSGETLSALQRCAPAGAGAPAPIISSVLVGALYGLHAAHEATAEDGHPLNIVHRDVSPQNIIVGVDGVARVLDFGVAKAALRSQVTKDGEIKGKISYMAPEQLRAHAIDRRTDIFAAGIVLWEALTGRRLFRGDDLGETVERVLHSEIAHPAAIKEGISQELDAVVLKALDRDPGRRFASAREFAVALESATAIASASEVADWVRALGGSKLAQRIQHVAAIESHSSSRVKVSRRSALDTPLGLRVVGAPDVGSAMQPDAAAPANVSSERTSAPEPRRSRKPLWAGGALLSAIVVAAFAWSGREPANAPVEAPAVSSASPIVERSAPRRTPPPSPLAAPAAASDAIAVPAANVLPAASAKPSVSKRSTASAAKPAPSPQTVAKPSRKASAAVAANCNPPYVVDAKGIRRIKPECL